MTRSDLLDILAAIQSRPENRDRDIMATGKRCTGPGDLRAFVWREFKALRFAASVDTVVAMTRAIAESNGQVQRAA